MTCFRASVLALSLASLSLPALSAEDAATTEDPAVAIVNGEALPRSLLTAYVQTRGRNASGSPVEELVIQELLQKVALEQGLDKRPEVEALMLVAQRNVLANMAVKEFLENNVPDDAALRSAYDEQYEAAEGKEFKASHILVESEEEAKAVIGELDAGSDFAELAKERSTGPSGPNGGDLGWFQSSSMVPEFGNAVSSMEKGKHSSEPVKTQFGWHVILLEDSRAVEPPTFESVRPKLTQQVQSDALAQYMKSLRESAEVEIK